MKLSKSGYLSYLQCPREFWLSHQMPELFSREESMGDRYRKEMGYRVQQLAQELFSAGAFGECQFEKRLETEMLLAKIDIYAGGNIYEVKSSGSVKDEHIDDVAFQKVVAEETGTPVQKCFIVHINKDYVRQGDIEPDKLFTIVDVTTLVDERLPETRLQIAEALEYLKTEPGKSLLGYCGSKLKCLFIQHFHKDLPEHTVFDIANLKAEKLNKLLAAGILNVADIPAELELTPRQRRQVEAVRSGEPFISAEEIKVMLGALEYPLYFLDYETVNPAIPLYDGYRPYQVLVFQFSVHALDGDGGELRHGEFLADGHSDPTHELIKTMRELIDQNGGTVIVWSAYENTNNKNIAARFPEFADFMESVNRRTFDLMGIFSKGLYVDAKFKGSYSIKNVLPVLRPEMNYEHLEIKDGSTAAAMWLEMLTGQKSDEDRHSIRGGLLEYCAQDTLALAEIWKTLKEEFCA